jgi:hypothetical protein
MHPCGRIMFSIQSLVELAQRRQLTCREEQVLSQLIMEDDRALDEYLSICHLEADLHFCFATRNERADDDTAPR